MNKENKEELLRKIKGWRNLVVKSSISYNWDMTDEQAYEQIKALIQKPQVTEEWVEEKAKKFLKLAYSITRTEPDIMEHQINLKFIKEEFIRSLVEKIQGRKHE